MVPKTVSKKEKLVPRGGGRGPNPLLPGVGHLVPKMVSAKTFAPGGGRGSNPLLPGVGDRTGGSTLGLKAFWQAPDSDGG